MKHMVVLENNDIVHSLIAPRPIPGKNYATVMVPNEDGHGAHTETVGPVKATVTELTGRDFGGYIANRHL